MLPLNDENNYKGTPVVTYILLALNIFLFLFQAAAQIINDDNYAGEVLQNAFAMIPAEILSGKHIIVPGFREPTSVPVILTLFTSAFIHGGFWHLLGNMLFLWIFADNVEKTMGSLSFLVFYLVCTLLADFFHIGLTILLDQNLNTPTLGASGAISGVIGAYFLLFPRNKVFILIPPLFLLSILNLPFQFLRFIMGILFKFLIPFVFVIFYRPVPAFLFGAIWIVSQLIGSIALLNGSESGIAYGAHLGGLLAGVLIVLTFSRLRKNKPETASLSTA